MSSLIVRKAIRYCIIYSSVAKFTLILELVEVKNPWVKLLISGLFYSVFAPKPEKIHPVF